MSPARAPTRQRRAPRRARGTILIPRDVRDVELEIGARYWRPSCSRISPAARW